ncbi:hypothetical protein HDU88_005003 [Geranomyces variabilis]|nr:hypothetical protein HDU88_005003 [Geranomyces variabilis]
METTNDDRPGTQRSHKDPESCQQYIRQRRPTITRSRSPVRTRSFSGRLPGPPRRLSVDELVPLAAEREEFDEQHSDNHSNRDGSQHDYQSLPHDVTPGGKTTPRTMKKIKVEPEDPESVPDESSALVLQTPSARASNQNAANAQQAPRIVPSLFAPVNGKIPSFSDFSLVRPPPDPSTPIPTLPTGNAWDASIDDPLSSRTMHRLIATTCAKHRPPLGIDIPGRTHAEVLRAWASTVPASVDLGSAYWMLETGGEAALSGVKRRRIGTVARLTSASAMHELLVSQGYTFVDSDDDENVMLELASAIEPPAANDDSDPDAEGEPDEDDSFGEFDDGGGGAAASRHGPAYIYNAARSIHRPTPRPSPAAAATSHHLVRVHLSSAPAYHPWTPPTQGAFAAGESSTPLFDSMYIPRDVTSSAGGTAPTLTYVLNGPHRRLPMLGGLPVPFD